MRLSYLLLACILLPTTLAQGLYADVTFDVQTTGEIHVSGLTNHPSLTERSTQEFTSKNKEYWLVNITISEVIDDYVFTIVLPPNANLNYVNSKNVNILSDGDRITLKLVGSDSPVTIVAQYKLNVQEQMPWLKIVAAVVLFIAALIGLAWISKKGQSKKTAPVAVKEQRILEDVSARQKDVISILRKHGGVLTQKQLMEKMQITKSSLSRNVDALRRRGIIEKESSGMTNIVSLAEKYR